MCGLEIPGLRRGEFPQDPQRALVVPEGLLGIGSGQQGRDVVEGRGQAVPEREIVGPGVGEFRVHVQGAPVQGQGLLRIDGGQHLRYVAQRDAQVQADPSAVVAVVLRQELGDLQGLPVVSERLGGIGVAQHPADVVQGDGGVPLELRVVGVLSREVPGDLQGAPVVGQGRGRVGGVEGVGQPGVGLGLGPGAGAGQLDAGVQQDGPEPRVLGGGQRDAPEELGNLRHQTGVRTQRPGQDAQQRVDLPRLGETRLILRDLLGAVDDVAVDRRILVGQQRGGGLGDLLAERPRRPGRIGPVPDEPPDLEEVADRGPGVVGEVGDEALDPGPDHPSPGRRGREQQDPGCPGGGAFQLFEDCFQVERCWHGWLLSVSPLSLVDRGAEVTPRGRVGRRSVS